MTDELANPKKQSWVERSGIKNLDKQSIKNRRRILKESTDEILHRQARYAFADRAASMVLGEYEFPPKAKFATEPGRWTIRAVFESLGYAGDLSQSQAYPEWWPGLEAMSRLVQSKIVMRQMQANIDLSGQNSWAGPILGAFAEETLRRMATDPSAVPTRDLIEGMSKLARLMLKPTEEGGRKTQINVFNIGQMAEKMPPALRARMIGDGEAAAAKVMEMLGAGQKVPA